MSNSLRLTIYDFDTGKSEMTMGATGTRFVYAAERPVILSSAVGEGLIDNDEGRIFGGTARLKGAGWLFELADQDAPLLGGKGIDPVLSHVLELDFDDRMLRADRVASNPGALTPLHGHRGPGIRRLVKGRIRATIGDNLERIEAGQAWFETGKDWVVGENISDGENVFVRVMVLPAELEGGKSSFVPASDDEATRSRSVSYRLFAEKAI